MEAEAVIQNSILGFSSGEVFGPIIER